MEFSSNTGMSFRTRLPSNSPRAGIRCSASRFRSKHERNVTQQPISLHSQGFYGQSLPAINLGISSSWSADVVPQSSQHLCYAEGIRIWLLVQRLFGWLLSKFFVAGIPGLVKSDQ